MAASLLPSGDHVRPPCPSAVSLEVGLGTRGGRLRGPQHVLPLLLRTVSASLACRLSDGAQPRALPWEAERAPPRRPRPRPWGLSSGYRWPGCVCPFALCSLLCGCFCAPARKEQHPAGRLLTCLFLRRERSQAPAARTRLPSAGPRPPRASVRQPRPLALAGS